MASSNGTAWRGRLADGVNHDCGLQMIKFRYGIGVLVVALGIGLAACQQHQEADTGLNSWLFKPEGEGPSPAVVLMHGCGGLQRDTPHRTVWRALRGHAFRLNANGYVALIVDSFGPRGLTDVCQVPRKGHAPQYIDAHAAFDYLASLPDVDSRRIGFVGRSLGGDTALELSQGTSVDSRVASGLGTYAAVVAFYPWCQDHYAYSLRRPVLILTGAKDDWTPAARCRDLDRVTREWGRKHLLELVVYSDAHHSFDTPMGGPYYVEGRNGRRHTVQGNPEARRASQARMIEFFDNHLAAVR